MKIVVSYVTMCTCILQSMMYKKVMTSQVRNTLANELMMYHMKVFYMSMVEKLIHSLLVFLFSFLFVH